MSKPRSQRQPAHSSADSAVVPARHAPGAGSHLAVEERRAIQVALLTEPHATVSSVAKQFGRTREAVAKCRGGEDFERLRVEVEKQKNAIARDELRKYVDPAVKGWGKAVGVAAGKGDHRPSKELLLHTGVIEPLSGDGGGPSVIVQIGAKDSDVQILSR